jgi:hypothetical protein
MKQDVPPLPARVPTKRYQMHRLLDLHIAMWLAGETITRDERRRLQEEKVRRKTLRPSVVVAVIGAKEGLTPAQREFVRGYLATIAPNEVHTVAPIRAVSGALNMLDDTPVTVHTDSEDAIRASTIVLVAPRSESAATDAVRFAKHRKVPVRVILPSGEEG